MRAAFAADPGRFSKLSLSAGGMLLDWSKCAVTGDTMALLLALAEAADVEGRRDAMLAGEKINVTEDRAVLHVALRAPETERIMVDGVDVVPDVHKVLAAMSEFADAVRSGKASGATGKKITDIVNIGIGGSDLGPAMAALALAPFHDGPRTHFVSNVDGAHIADTLKGLAAETTLFIVASKTFTTVETMTNAETARRWVGKALGRGRRRPPFRGGVDRARQGRGLRHRARPGVRLLGLGGRPLFAVVGDRPADHDRRRSGAFPRLPGRRA